MSERMEYFIELRDPPKDLLQRREFIARIASRHDLTDVVGQDWSIPNIGACAHNADALRLDPDVVSVCENIEVGHHG